MDEKCVKEYKEIIKDEQLLHQPDNQNQTSISITTSLNHKFLKILDFVFILFLISLSLQEQVSY